MKRLFSLLLGAAALVALESAARAQPFSPDDTARISFANGVGSGGAADADISNPQMSKNGRFVVFESTATNLVALTQLQPSVALNGKKQVYLYDRQANSLELVSVTRNGEASPVDCYEPSVSNDGRYVAFVADLRDDAVPGQTGKAIFAANFNDSVGPKNAHSPACQNGDCNQAFHVGLFFPGRHILARDRLANETLLVSLAEIVTARQLYENGDPKFEGGTASIKTETLRVANTRYDVVTGVVEVSDGPNRRQRGASESRRPYVSGDGAYIVYDTDGFTGGGYRVASLNIERKDDFVVWEKTVETGSGPDLRKAIFGEDGKPSNDDDYLLPGPRKDDVFDYGDWLDNNIAVRDIYVRDGGASPSTKVVSFDCRYHQPRPLSCSVVSARDSSNPSISDDGQFIAFESLMPFLSGDFNQVSDVYVLQRDKISQDIVGLERISNSFSRITAPNASSQRVRISADGRFVVYDSAATNVALGDTNGKSDVFVFDRSFFQTTQCLGPQPADPAQSPPQGNGDSLRPTVSGSGEVVAFESNSTNWGSPGGLFQAYVARTSKDRLGRVVGCTSELASKGAGDGGNGDSSYASAAVVPRSATATPNPTTTPGTTTPGIVPTPEVVRFRVASVAYRSAATDVGLRAPSGTPAADTNGFADMFQAPRCSDRDLGNDKDADGTVDCFDMCWNDYKKVEDVDSDSDGVADCEDNCPEDPQKLQKGICGCGKEDVDSDFDGTFDCQDDCPTDPLKTRPGLCGCFRPDTDSDEDGKPDCDDLCPGDRLKVEPGACGCGKPDFGNDGKILVGCATPTPAPPTATPTPTPIPFEGRQPEKPTVKRLTTKKFAVTVSAEGLPEAPRQYRLSVERTDSERPVTVVRSTGTRVVVSGLRKGRYRIRYQAIASSGKKTLFSAYSSNFQVR